MTFLSPSVASRQLRCHDIPVNDHFLARYHTDVLVWLYPF